jgi:cytochrome c peroxidase
MRSNLLPCAAFSSLAKSHGCPPWCLLLMLLALVVGASLGGGLPANSSALGQDQFVYYFDGITTDVGDLGGQTFDAAGNFWFVGRSAIAGPVPVPRISKVMPDGSGGWVVDPHVFDEDLAFFYRSADPASGTTNPQWGGPTFGTPASFLLNPAALTITVPTGSGGFVTQTYQPGELAFMTDAMGVIAEPNGTARYDATKKLVRYDLRKVDNPAGISGPTAQLPDFANASNGNGISPVGIQFGAAGLADWNDVFTMVVSEQDLRDAAGGVAGSDNFGRQFAWSSDGQSIYAIDAGSNTGGIYRIDATQTGSVTRIWSDTTSNEFGDRIISEPVVIATSVRDFDPANSAEGDQILVEGSADGGNNGGVNAYLDTGGPVVGAPRAVFTESEFRAFAEYVGTSAPQYLSFAADGEGNLYFHEGRTDGVFLYDTLGRFAKIASEGEHNAFQASRGFAPNDNVLDMQVRTSQLPGFSVPEIVFTDDSLDAPVGILAYRIGDFNRDNAVDSDDWALFRSALGTRGQPAEEANYKFDLNGNAVLAFDPEDQTYDHVSGGAMVVDWKDVKILQEFTGLLTGDANFDGLVDFADLDIMAANYFTLPGQNQETWADGDFASADPNYAFDAADANLVDLTDLQVLADTWLQTLGQPPVTAADADARGYFGQFRLDLLSVFAPSGPLAGDFNRDGRVDAGDYTIWRDSFDQLGLNLPADANGDFVVNRPDYEIWRANYGRTAAASGLGSPTPEPGTALLALVALGAARGRRVRQGLGVAIARATLGGVRRERSKWVWSVTCVATVLALGGETEAARPTPRPEQTPTERAEHLAMLRAEYAQPASQWPTPEIEPGVDWQELGEIPKVVAPPENPSTPEKVSLGKQLFFDPRLSGSRQIACASCHDPSLGWGDGRPVSFGHDREQLTRNAPSLLNSGLRKSFFWDGRAKSLEEQAEKVLTNPSEMHSSHMIVVAHLAEIPGYVEAFAEVFGPDSVSLQNAVAALAAFERTIVGGRSRFDFFLRGKSTALTDEELSGLHLFRTTARCLNCHHGPLLSDEQFHHIGLSNYGRRYEDLGRYLITNDPADVGAFRTPSLRDVMHTGPYMHSGMFTIDEALTLYNAGMPSPKRRADQADDPLFPTKSPLLKPLHLNEQDLVDLKAFLGALSEPQFRVEPPPLPR